MDTTDPQPARIVLEYMEEGEAIHAVVEAESCCLSDHWIHFVDLEGMGFSHPREQVIAVEWLSEPPVRAEDEPLAEVPERLLRGAPPQRLHLTPEAQSET